MAAGPLTSAFRLRGASIASANFEVDAGSLAQGRANLIATLLLGGPYPVTVFPAGHERCFRFQRGTHRPRPLFDPGQQKTIHVSSGQVVLRLRDRAQQWITLKPIVAHFSDPIFYSLPQVVGQCAYLGRHDLDRNGISTVSSSELLVTWI